MSRTVYIVRHGNTFDQGDIVTRVGARTDLPLSSSGRVQGEALARHFADQGLVFSAAFSSPLQRTMRTAQMIIAGQEIIAGQDRALEIEPVEFLREIDYGPDENRPEREVIERIGQPALDLWEGEARVPDGWQIDTGAVTDAWRDFLTGLGQTATGPALVVTSNGIARFALQLAMAGNHGDYTLKLSTGAYGIIQVGQDGAMAVADWNVRP